MPQEKHGQYDKEHDLPDNRMQPVGSGYNVWLNQKIIAIFGNDTLLDQSASHKEKRYEWLCDRLIESGHSEVVEEYRRKQKEDAAERRIRDKRRDLALWKDRLAETTIEDQKGWYRKRIAKCEKYLKERENVTEENN